MLVFEPHCGVSGDMLLGCLVDLGGDPALLEGLQKALRSQEEEIALSVQKIQKKGIRATRVAVKDHAPPSGRSGKAMRALMERTASLCGASERVLEDALKALELLLGAEAQVHGASPEEVHLHEAASADTILDMLGFFLLLENMGYPPMASTPLRVGGGHVQCAHGLLPVPVPAVTALLAQGKLPFQGGPVEEEIATPTGVALLLSQATFYSHFPRGTSLGVGYGAGTKDFAVPNVLRGTLVRSETSETSPDSPLWILETGIDDATGEEMGYALEKLRALAPEVYLSQGIGKKGRPFFLLRVLAEEKDREELTRQILKLTSTLGVRSWRVERVALDRKIEKKTVFMDGKPYPLRVKISSAPGICKEKPEFDDVAALLEEESSHA
jgi:hypothetical protein